MKLKDLTDRTIRDFAGATLYGRGRDYFTRAMVRKLSYDPSSESLRAEVAGNYGDYDVEVTLDGNEIDASCDCPYDGYPCKHIVATLLAYLHDSEKYAHKADEKMQKDSALKSELAKLPKNELVSIIISCAAKYPDFQRELMVRFQADHKSTLNAILKQVSLAFPSIRSRSYSTSRIAGTLGAIHASVDSASDEMKIAVNRAIAERILEELNEYGMNDEDLESVLFDSIDALVKCLQNRQSGKQTKREIIGKLMDYYILGNCGVVDAVYDTVMELSSEDADYQVVIDKLKPRAAGESYYQQQLASLYEIMGDDAALLRTLEQNLKYGMGYWRLAQYWLDKGDKEKALETVRTGVQHGEGRKTELYQHLEQHYLQQNDYEKLSDLLDMKITGRDLDHHALNEDSMYRALWHHYESQVDYQGLSRLLRMRLKGGWVNLGLYRDAEKTLKENDWAAFEKEMLAHLRRTEKDKRGSWGPQTGGPAAILAEIYNYKGDLENLLALARNHHDLLVKYEQKLIPSHPEVYLKAYCLTVERLIQQRGRESYRTAARYLKTVKEIHKTVLKQPQEWDSYFTRLKAGNKQLRALQEELRGL